MSGKLWDFWAGKYHGLWVQKYSLKPTRDYILQVMGELGKREEPVRILDVGCGPGELMAELQSQFEKAELTGIDFSSGMLAISRQKNKRAKHLKMDVADLGTLKERYQVIVCTHSLPYYKEPEKVMRNLHRLLADDGILYMGFASGNSLYDRLLLSLVKLTTGPASYPSHEKYKGLVRPYFLIEHVKIIRERPFMPRIAVYTLKKVLL